MRLITFLTCAEAYRNVMAMAAVTDPLLKAHADSMAGKEKKNLKPSARVSFLIVQNFIQEYRANQNVQGQRIHTTALFILNDCVLFFSSSNID